MTLEEIHEALTNVAVIQQDQASIRARRSANARDIGITRQAFIRFIELLDGDVTVSEVRDALELDPEQRDRLL